MVFVMMTDKATGRVAIFDENGTSGDPENPNSTRNAPLNNPVAHLSKVRFHVDFDYYQVHSGPTSVPVTHPSVATASTDIEMVGGYNLVTRVGQIVTNHINLVAHGLPYVPAYMVVLNGCLIGQSSLIQVGASGQRRISPYATSTHIRLMDVGISSNVALPSLARTYQVIVFKQPAEDSPYLVDIDPDNNRFVLGRGKWRGELHQLRRSNNADASPLDIALGRTTDIRGGASRTVLADGTVYTSPGYTGSFGGSPSVEGTVE